MGFTLWLWRLQFANLKMTIEIVAFPLQMVIFHGYGEK